MSIPNQPPPQLKKTTGYQPDLAKAFVPDPNGLFGSQPVKPGGLFGENPNKPGGLFGENSNKDKKPWPDRPGFCDNCESFQPG